MRVTLNGEVISDDVQWLYDYFDIPGFSPGVVRQALRDNPEGEELVLEINSVGGSVFAGFEIFTLLRGAGCPTVAEVQSLAASAASTVMSGCSRVLVSPVAQIMLHQPQLATDGNIDDHDRSIRMLESIQRSIVNGYAARCGEKATRRQLENLMNRESWLTAQEAVDIGLADGILGQEEGGAALAMNVVNSVGSGIRSLASGGYGGHSPADLLARYEQAVRAGAEPAPGHPVQPQVPEIVTPDGEGPSDHLDSWRRNARLDIEKNRFI
ncbi:MAG: head maturation protease, ClpP-related [Lachnospirales bacterium]